MLRSGRVFQDVVTDAALWIPACARTKPSMSRLKQVA